MHLAIGACSLRLKQGDLTREAVDAIVNAANSSLLGGGGVDGAIHRGGGPAILEECRALVAKIGRLPAGQAVITGGGRLPARRVIHTVGPVWSGGARGEDETLASAYRESLALAKREGVQTIAFPSVSTGAYRFPVDRAARIALTAVRDFLVREAAPREVTFVLFDAETLLTYATALERLRRA